MGAYTDGVEVLGTLLNLKVGAVRMTAAEVEVMVNGLENEINGVLKAQGYTVPATGDHDTAMLGEKVRRKAAADLYLMLHQPERAPDFVRSWTTDWDTFLNNIRGGKQQLIDQSPTVAGYKQAILTSFSLGFIQTETGGEDSTS